MTPSLIMDVILLVRSVSKRYLNPVGGLSHFLHRSSVNVGGSSIFG